ncbi:MAG: nuclear transport factor 2 family protein [bacterium]|nr:nuclear transport factor 2 family protein [bacterium]
MKFRILFIITAMAFLTTACQTTPEIDIEAEKAAVGQVVHNSIEWALDKNTEKLYGSFVQDETLFFFEPSAEMHGFSTLKEKAETIWLDDRFKATRTDITDLNVTISQSGTAAWFRCMLDDEGEWDGQVSGWYNLRWTGVLEKRGGKWLIVQQHFSFAAEQ